MQWVCWGSTAPYVCTSNGDWERILLKVTRVWLQKHASYLRQVLQFCVTLLLGLHLLQPEELFTLQLIKLTLHLQLQAWQIGMAA